MQCTGQNKTKIRQVIDTLIQRVYSLLVERGRTVGLQRRRERAGRLERPRDHGRLDGRRRSAAGGRLFVRVPGDLQRRADLMLDHVALDRGGGGAERGRLDRGHDHLLGHGAALEHGLAGRELGLAIVLVGYGELVAADARRPAKVLAAAAVGGRVSVVGCGGGGGGRRGLRRRRRVGRVRLDRSLRRRLRRRHRLDGERLDRSLRHGLLAVEYVRQRF